MKRRRADENYVYARSHYIGESTFGLYDYSGREILAAEYSLEEINALIANNFAAPEKAKAQSTGEISYSDRDDGTHEQRITPDNTDDFANAEILTTIEYHKKLSGFEEYRYTLPEGETQGRARAYGKRNLFRD